MLIFNRFSFKYYFVFCNPLLMEPADLANAESVYTFLLIYPISSPGSCLRRGVVPRRKQRVVSCEIASSEVITVFSGPIQSAAVAANWRMLYVHIGGGVD